MRTYQLAGPTDDDALRALLRDNAMPSWATLSLEREPSYFAGTGHFGRDWCVIAKDESTSVGMYACSEQAVHVNGVPEEMGYLGSLRVCPAYRHRLRVLRDGYASIPKFSKTGGKGLWYTSIASENLSARRLLEANLPGMPRYQRTNDMVTMALPQARAKGQSLWRPMLDSESLRVCAFHNQCANQYQFSPALTPKIVERTGADFFVIERNGELVACMALWNQQAYKQVVAKGYRQPLAALLPLYNGYARIARRAQLPPVGQSLDQTYLAFLAVAPSIESECISLIEDALTFSKSPVVTFGLHSGHAWLEPLFRTFCPLTYRSSIYAVRFEEGVELDGRPAQPEVAVL